MRVETSTKSQVSSRLAMLVKETEKNSNKDLFGSEENFHDIVKAKDEEARRRKEERDRQRKERKKKAKEKAQQPPEHEDGDGDTEVVEEEAIDPALAAMMGFSGFGGGKKNH